MTKAGGSDAWAQSTLRINVPLSDMDLAFGELPFWATVSADVRKGTV
jgi:hypothetical protein